MTTNNLNDTYAFATRHSDGLQCIKIIDGPLMGAVVHIKKVSFPIKPDSNGNFKLGIKYDFIEKPSVYPDDDKIIDQVLGEIVVDIIQFHNVEY